MPDLDRHTTFELRYALALALRKQEAYLDTIGDSVLMAAEQVQDKRIELLERGPELSASEVLVEVMINLAFGIGGTYIKAGIEHMIKRVIAWRLLASVVDPSGVKITPNLTRDRIKQALDYILRDLPKEKKQIIETKEERSLFVEFAKEASGVVLEKSKDWVKDKQKESKKPAQAKEEPGGDSAGVALMDTVLTNVRQQQLASRAALDMTDLQVACGVTDAATLKDLLHFLEADKQVQTRHLPFKDLARLRHDMRLFYEACIWAYLFSPQNWAETKEEGALVHGLSYTVRLTEPPVTPALYKYWMGRFQSLSSFPSTGSTLDRLKSYFGLIQEGMGESGLQLIRLPEPKK